MPSGLKILFCVNPGAGAKRGMDWPRLIATHFAGGPHEAIVLPLERDREAAIREVIAAQRPQRVIAVGGDGTVNLLANIVGGTALPMGIIPAGSANGLATDVGIPADPAPALRLITEGQVRPMDAILINEKDLCLHLSDIGMNAQLIKYFEESGYRGMFGYARLSLKTIWRKKRFKVTVTAGREQVLRSAVMVVLANARKYGTGAVINKEGSLDDARFEVVLVRRFGLRELWISIMAHRRYDPKRIEVLQASEVEISTTRKTHFQIDGDYKGRVKNVKARILPGHVHLIRP